MRLVELVRAGDLDAVVRELGGLTSRQRVSQQPGLRGHRASVGDWREVAPEVKAALSAAELGCQVTPVAAAAWCLQHRYFTLDTWTVEVMNLYPVAWRAELAARLAARATASDTVFTLAEHLVHDTGCPVPASQEFILAWFFNRAKNRARPPGVRGGAAGADLLERLRADGFTPKLVPLAVARPGRLVLGRPQWLLGALIALTAEGVADRHTLIRGLFADMAADLPNGAHAVSVLETLALTPAEHALVAPDRAALVRRLLGRLLQDSTRTRSEPVLAFLRALAATPAAGALLDRHGPALLDGSPTAAARAREILAAPDEEGLPQFDGAH